MILARQYLQGAGAAEKGATYRRCRRSRSEAVAKIIWDAMMKFQSTRHNLEKKLNKGRKQDENVPWIPLFFLRKGNRSVVVSHVVGKAESEDSKSSVPVPYGVPLVVVIGRWYCNIRQSVIVSSSRRNTYLCKMKNKYLI